jgi:sulfatase modifying factor 1
MRLVLAAKVSFRGGEVLPSPERVNYRVSGLGTTTSVSLYPPNPLGLYDMAGNVWKWILDEWSPTYSIESTENPIMGGNIPDDSIRTIQDRRVIRGGSFGADVVHLRTRWRDSHIVSNAVEFVGFRCVYCV